MKKLTRDRVVPIISRQRFLTERSHDRLRSAFLAEIRKQKKKSGETLFARIKQLVDQVLFNTTVPSQQIRHEQFDKLCLIMNGRHNVPLLYLTNPTLHNHP